MTIHPVHLQKGLTMSQAERSRRDYGDNTLAKRKKQTLLRRVLAGFGDPIIKILLVSLAVNILVTLKNFNPYETIGIVAAILLATLISALSERGSELAFEKLQEQSEKIFCKVRRDGKILSLPLGEIVVGDIILLSAGEMVPADGKVLEGKLLVNQSALNGESKEVEKKPSKLAEQGLSAESLVFRGSVICGGDAVMVAEKVGRNTFYGSMAEEIQEDTRESPLKMRLARLAEKISRLGYLAAFAVAFAYLFDSLVIESQFNPTIIAGKVMDFPFLLSELIHTLTLAVTVIVVAVPEGLPMMITVVLSSNMNKMLKDNVLVRKLVGIETAGSLNILFTDKTGTITEGKFSVSRFVLGNGTTYSSLEQLKRAKEVHSLYEASALYNTSSVISGDGKALGGNSTDRALLDSVLPLKGPNANVGTAKEKLPFDSAKKYSAARIRYHGRDLTLIKGAPEKIMPGVTRYYNQNGELCEMTDRRRLQTEWHAMAAGGGRVLAIAVSDSPIRAGESSLFANLSLVALVSIKDCVRSSAKSAIADVRMAGVQVVMITGDNKETAEAIAKESGLISSYYKGKVLTSDELAGMTDEQLCAMLPDIRVIARALPQDKSRLVRIAQSAGLVTGMTGDGINDAPALKKADVGFAMGSGTEIAKEAGDIVIMDNNFASIVKAILYGRTIFKSIRKFIVFQLTMNLCAVGVSLVGPFIGIDTPVTVLQMLWINMIMDTLGGLAFAGEPPLAEYLKEKPKKREEEILSPEMTRQILFMGCHTLMIMIIFLKANFIKVWFRYDENPLYFLTAFFALFVFAGIFNCFNARTERAHILADIHRNKPFLIIMTGIVAIQIVLIYFGGEFSRTVGLSFRELVTVVGIALLVIPGDILRKLKVRVVKAKKARAQ